jgi:hypothetical protein
VFYNNYLLIKTKLNNNGVNMPKPIQFKTLLLLMLLFSSSTNVFSQIKEDYIDHEWENDRYTDNGDGTVTDTKTALMWKQCAEDLSDDCTGTATTYRYKAAIEQAEKSTFAGHTNRRLPNIKELLSLVALDRSEPTINSNFFPSTNGSVPFWSSSPKVDVNSTSVAWRVSFSKGNRSGGGRSLPHYVRLVRDVE